MTEAEARALAANTRGVYVRRHKGTWEFIARFQSTDRAYKKYCGKNYKYAVATRRLLLARYSKRGRRSVGTYTKPERPAAPVHHGEESVSETGI